MPEKSNSMLSGIAGAAALTALNYLGKKVLPGTAPHLNELGEAAVRNSAEGMNLSQPSQTTTEATALGGSLTTNSLIYSLAGVGKSDHPELRGALVGAAMGLGVVLLAPRLGYGNRPVGEGVRGKAIAVSQYMLGGLVAGMTRRVQRSML